MRLVNIYSINALDLYTPKNPYVTLIFIVTNKILHHQVTLQMLHQEGPEQPQPVTPKNE